MAAHSAEARGPPVGFRRSTDRQALERTKKHRALDVR